MMDFTELEVGSFADFELRDRIFDPQGQVLPRAILDRLRPLTTASSARARGIARLFRRMGPYIPRQGIYSVTDTVDLDIRSIRDVKRFQRWLGGLPIENSSAVCVHWSDRDCALLTDWSTFRESWNILWRPFDVMDVFDESLSWALLLGQEDVAWYMLRNSAAGSTTKEEEEPPLPLPKRFARRIVPS